MFTERKIQKNKSYTYESKALKLCSRIDFFLLPQHQISRVEQIVTVVCNAPDHKAVKLKLNSPNNKRGPGLWKFNNSLLDDESYATLIGENYILDWKIKGLNGNYLKWS